MNKKINNSIQAIDRKSVEFIKSSTDKNNNLLIAEIDGANVKSWEDYAAHIQKEFQFPTSCLDSIDRYLDWMRDLSWLEKEGFVLIITNYSEFMAENFRLKNDIILDFKEIILPFWEKEVEDVVVEGVVKPFVVYLVD